MNFSKVKMIIILCLLTVNIIFAILCVKLLTEKNYISDEEASLAEAKLSKNGVSIQFDKNAKKLYNLPVYVVSDENGETTSVPEIYKQITQAFFGVTTDNTAYIKTPDGYSVNVKNDGGILIGSASVSEKMHFECSFEKEDTYKYLRKTNGAGYFKQLTEDKNSDYDKAKEFVDKALRNYNMKFTYTGTESFSEGSIVCFTGELSGIPTPGTYINVYVRKNKIICCAGEIPAVCPEKKYRTGTVDSIDAVFFLTDYIRENGSEALGKNAQIKNISMTYDLVEFGYGEYYVIPAWVMEYKTDSSESVIYTVDAVTGGIIRTLG